MFYEYQEVTAAHVRVQSMPPQCTVDKLDDEDHQQHAEDEFDSPNDAYYQTLTKSAPHFYEMPLSPSASVLSSDYNKSSLQSSPYSIDQIDFFTNLINYL